MDAKTTKAYSVILFFSTSHALKAEKVVQSIGFNCKLIPVPRHLSSDCGVCLRIASSDKQAVLATLTERQVEFEGCYDIQSP
jgi:hypothetical protein